MTLFCLTEAEREYRIHGFKQSIAGQISFPQANGWEKRTETLPKVNFGPHS